MLYFLVFLRSGIRAGFSLKHLLKNRLFRYTSIEINFLKIIKILKITLKVRNTSRNVMKEIPCNTHPTWITQER